MKRHLGTKVACVVGSSLDHSLFHCLANNPTDVRSTSGAVGLIKSEQADSL